VDLLLLDYSIPGMSCEEILTRIRRFNPEVQIILQTDDAYQQPPRELLQRLDIRGYFNKAESPERLLLWLELGLKLGYLLQLLARSRQGMQFILDAATDVHKNQPLTNLLQGIFLQVSRLLGATNSFLAVLTEGNTRSLEDEVVEDLPAMVDEDVELVIHAGTGCFNDHSKVSEIVEAGKLPLIYETLRSGKVGSIAGTTVVPLQVGETAIGVIYLDRKITRSKDRGLLRLFANQAAVAIQNAQLYDITVIDRLTGLHARGFFEKYLCRELRMAFCFQQLVLLLLLDVDNLKQINDVAGHLAGDHAIATVGEVLRQSTRNTDVAGRYGSDEFAVLLPQMSEEGAKMVGQRILNLLREKNMRGPKGNLPLHCSLGLSALKPHSMLPNDIPRSIPFEYFENMSRLLFKSADIALCQSRAEGGDQMHIGASVEWLPFT